MSGDRDQSKGRVMNWLKIDFEGVVPPEREVVMTKIDDAEGVRNEQPLYRQGSLWFLADGSMYVYYRPTHWAPMPNERAAS